jgi:hypothetical protein
VESAEEGNLCIGAVPTILEERIAWSLRAVVENPGEEKMG